MAKLNMKNKFLLFVIIVLFIGLIECDGLELNVPDEVVFVIKEKETKDLGFNKNFNYTTISDFKKFELTCSGDKPFPLLILIWKFGKAYLDYTSVHNGSKYYSTLKI
ncbi:hypothetical protein Avbf_17721 [Armadillidium vulgare]|nr:hypothetical protein Avbf_17721 [Armadillidium vulgare]